MVTAYFLPDRVGVVRSGDDVYVARLPDGPIVQLSGTAAIIWSATVDEDGGRPVDRVAARAGVPSAQIADDVERFLASLVERGLLISQDGARY